MTTHVKGLKVCPATARNGLRCRESGMPPVSRMFSRWALRFAAVVFCVALAVPAGATVILPADLSQVVESSQLIVHGRVVEVRGAMTGGRRSIHSVVTVAVNGALKG